MQAPGRSNPALPPSRRPVADFKGLPVRLADSAPHDPERRVEPHGRPVRVTRAKYQPLEGRRQDGGKVESAHQPRLWTLRGAV